MLTINHKTKAFLLIMLVNLACNPVFAETASHEAVQGTTKNLNISGLYLGFFPCDDCKGIRTTLALNGNGTYVYISLYVGKSDREIVEKGKYTWGREGNMLFLTPKKGSAVSQQYFIDDDILVKLDENGNRITKDGADRFILKRKDVMTEKGSQHSGH